MRHRASLGNVQHESSFQNGTNAGQGQPFFFSVMIVGRGREVFVVWRIIKHDYKVIRTATGRPYSILVLVRINDEARINEIWGQAYAY